MLSLRAKQQSKNYGQLRLPIVIKFFESNIAANRGLVVQWIV